VNRSRAAVPVLAGVLVTVIWYQLVWRGAQEDAAQASVDPVATEPVREPSPETPADTADGAGPASAADADDTGADAAATLRVVQLAAEAGGATLTSYTPGPAGHAGVGLKVGYVGLMELLHQLRAIDPGLEVASLDVAPAEDGLVVTLDLRRAAA
jgi:hypothetical protein